MRRSEGEGPSEMPNGKKGDEPLLDITYWKIRRFSEKADTLIAEIVNLGGKAELERTFNLLDLRQSRNLSALCKKFGIGCT